MVALQPREHPVDPHLLALVPARRAPESGFRVSSHAANDSIAIALAQDSCKKIDYRAAFVRFRKQPRDARMRDVAHCKAMLEQRRGDLAKYAAERR